MVVQNEMVLEFGSVLEGILKKGLQTNCLRCLFFKVPLIFIWCLMI